MIRIPLSCFMEGWILGVLFSSNSCFIFFFCGWYTCMESSSELESNDINRNNNILRQYSGVFWNKNKQTPIWIYHSKMSFFRMNFLTNSFLKFDDFRIPNVFKCNDLPILKWEHVEGLRTKMETSTDYLLSRHQKKEIRKKELESNWSYKKKSMSISIKKHA